ncbi:MAG: PhoX family phosphatase [Cyclobacteriaceae bacterium]
MMLPNRRKFLEILTKGTVSASLLPYTVSGYTSTQVSSKKVKGIAPSSEDTLVLAEDLDYNLLIQWGDSINEQDTFGFNNDFIAFIPNQEKADEGILWVIHEYINSMMIHQEAVTEKTQEQIEKEMYAVGGSLVRVKKENGQWTVVPHADNQRITGLTEIPFNWATPIEGKQAAMGTLGNCAGGVTPWGTVLTCEENYQFFYSDRRSSDRSSTDRSMIPSVEGWEKFYANPPEHYGWVVEVAPATGAAQKHVALGRCAHACATVKELEDGRLVVYTGDDKNDEHLYKFISSQPESLREGTLYVANLDVGKWIPVDVEQQPLLMDQFKTQTEALVYLRESAKILGATPLDRPEDIEIAPVSGDVLVALTNNIPQENYFGSILKIEEENGDHASLTFKATTYLTGGEDTGFASPDNMVFDRAGNLWFTSDISGSKMNQPPYSAFKNNGLFLVMRDGPQAGEVIQMASAPVDAEFTGPCFSPDGKTLFLSVQLSVQHPGEQSTSMETLTSHWPGEPGSIPRSAVVTIQGPLLQQIQQLS